MTGNVSKSKGFKGDKGDTPSIKFRYDEATGNLYYSSDGIMVGKEYVSGQDLIAKGELDAIKDALDKILEMQSSLGVE